MSDKPVVAFDIDGVLADFTYGFTRLHEGKARSQGTARQWQFRGHVDKTWARIDEDRFFWRNLPALFTHQERDEILNLTKRADLLFVTGRSDPKGNGAFEQTRKWLQQYSLPGTLILGVDKVGLLSGLGDQLVGVIEDKPDLLVQMAEAHLPTYIRDWEYNRHSVPLRPADYHYAHRVSSVGEFVYLMERKLDAR